MGIQIRQELATIISMHEAILNSLKTQKVRQDQLLDKYEKDIEEEMSLPANRFLNWSRMVQPYVDSVISGKIMEGQLLKRYHKFVEQIVRYESDYILSEQDIVDLEYNYDSLIDVILKLETKMIQVRDTYRDELTRAKVSAINIYQRTPFDKRPLTGVCAYCGIKIDYKLGDSAEECSICDSLPDAVKPFLRKESASDEVVSETPDIDPDFEKETYKAMEEPSTPQEAITPAEVPAPATPLPTADIPFDDEESVADTDEEDKDPEDSSLDDSMDDYEKEVSDEESKPTVPFVPPEKEPTKKPPTQPAPGLSPKEKKTQEDFQKMMTSLEKKYE